MNGAWRLPLGLGGPTILLAGLLPLALISSPGLRRCALIPVWALAFAPAIVALGALSSGSNARWIAPFLGIAALGLALFALSSRRDRQAGLPLAFLGGLALLVAYFSSGRGGSGPMIGWYERYGLTMAQAEALTLAFRKTVHFTFYGTVGWSALRATYATDAGRNESVRTAMLAALAVAACDELRQSGYTNRSGSPWDVLLDLGGAATFVGLSEWRSKKER